MENREILVANTKTQKRYKITTDATTVAELKQAFINNGIDYTDMDITEGISKTTLLDDSTPLPKDVMYKGSPTNNLMIILTNTRKKVASGLSRAEVYATIKENNLQQDVLEKFGRNFTQVSTDSLVEFLNSLEKTAKDTCGQDYEVEEEEEEEDDYEQPFDAFEAIKDILNSNNLTILQYSYIIQRCAAAIASVDNDVKDSDTKDNDNSNNLSEEDNDCLDEILGELSL